MFHGENQSDFLTDFIFLHSDVINISKRDTGENLELLGCLWQMKETLRSCCLENSNCVCMGKEFDGARKHHFNSNQPFKSRSKALMFDH